MAISFSRTDARESVRLATLAQAISRTSATATSRISRRVRTSLTRPVCNETAERSGVPGFRHGPGKQWRELRLQQADFGVGLLQRRARTQAADHRHEIAGPIGVRVARIDVERNPDVGLRRREAEVARHHADDLALHAFELDRVTDDVGIGGESPLPQRLAQDDETVLTGEIVAGVKGSSDRCVRAEDRKQFGGNEACRSAGWDRRDR